MFPPAPFPLNAPPGPAPILLSAIYDPDAPLLRLVFDRPVSAGACIFEAFLLVDAQFLHQYMLPSDVSGPDAYTVEFLLSTSEVASGSGVHLNATAENGIVAVADGEPWGGCTDLPLPFP